MIKIQWKWHDPSHFEAHRKEFSRPVEEILTEVAEQIKEEERKPGEWYHRDFLLGKETGKSGLALINREKDRSFWAYRPERSIPSHLIEGEKKPTKWICLWGWWDEKEFVIHTIYPGKVCPREIHDKDLPLSEMKEAVDFWSCHAIIVDKGAYSFTPHPL